MPLYRTTSDPGATCPEDLYTTAEIERMEVIAELEDQIHALDLQMMELDLRANGADMAGDIAQLGSLEDQYDVLIAHQDQLRKRLRFLSTID